MENKTLSELLRLAVKQVERLSVTVTENRHFLELLQKAEKEADRLASEVAENRQLMEMLNHEVSEVENLTEELHDLKEEFAEAYAKLESELAETKLAMANKERGE